MHAEHPKANRVKIMALSSMTLGLKIKEQQYICGLEKNKTGYKLSIFLHLIAILYWSIIDLQ